MDQKQIDEKKKYDKRIKERMPKSNLFLDCIKAFVVGGLICIVGQIVIDLGKTWLQLQKEDAATFASIVMVFLGALLTGLGVYDKIGSFAGAGSIVPITGFANSIVSPAMEFKREGYVLGLGAKMFVIAGPVLVYGISASIIVGLLALLGI